MNLKGSIIGLVLVAAALTVLNFIIQQTVFPPMEMPPDRFLLNFIFFAFWDALAFGIGVALLIYLAINFSKWPREIRGPVSLMFFVALWFSVLNWIHDGLHHSGAAPPNWQYLALTEYAFHVPWLLFAVGLVLAARKLIRIQTKK